VGSTGQRNTLFLSEIRRVDNNTGTLNRILPIELFCALLELYEDMEVESTESLPLAEVCFSVTATSNSTFCYGTLTSENMYRLFLCWYRVYAVVGYTTPKFFYLLRYIWAHYERTNRKIHSPNIPETCSFISAVICTLILVVYNEDFTKVYSASFAVSAFFFFSAGIVLSDCGY